MLAESVLTAAKRVECLQSFGESVFDTAKRVGDCRGWQCPFSSPQFVSEASRGWECPFMIAVKCVGSLQRVGVCIITTAMRVGGLQRLEMSVCVTENVYEACRSLESTI